MSNRRQTWKQNPEVVQELEDLLLRIRPAVLAARLWKNVLTATERKKLGGNLEASFGQLGTVGMWRKIHRVTQPRAILDIARAIGLLLPDRHEQLLREIGEPSQGDRMTRIPPGHPVWDTIGGRLYLKGRVIRKIRVLSRPSNVQRILDAFQKAKWQRRIETPLGVGQQKLHETIYTLNHGLKRIRFHGQEGGKAITWVAR